MRSAVKAFGLVLATVLSANSGAPATAAPSKATPAPAPSPDEASMQVSIVRANWPGCEPDCPEWIAARGRIDDATPAKFKTVLAQIGRRKLPVLIDSLGGSGLDGYTIGRMIRAKGLDVAVSQTDLQTCAKGDKTCTTTTATGVLLGRPKTLGSKCASACVHVLAGGVRRTAGIGTLVGVHQVKSFETRIKVLRTYRAYGDQKVLVSEKRMSSKTVPVATTTAVYSTMRRFFIEMGVRDTIMPLVMSAPNTKIHLMTRAELKLTNLVTGIAEGDQIVKDQVVKENASKQSKAVPSARPPHAAPIAKTPSRAAAAANAPSKQTAATTKPPKAAISPAPRRSISRATSRPQKRAASQQSGPLEQQFP